MYTIDIMYIKCYYYFKTKKEEDNKMLNTINATEIRNNWSSVVDTVIRDKPAFIKRTRDKLFLSNIDVLKALLDAYKFTATQYIEDDGSITLSLDAIDLAENAPTEKEAIKRLSESILDYAVDYYNDFSYWNRGNRESHIPYILKALILSDPKVIGGQLECRHGRI